MLVTGAGGFLGRSVLARLRRSHAGVVGVARRTAGDASLIECDLSSPAAVVRLLADRQPAVIVNLAAIVNFADGVLPSLYGVNTLCPAIMAEWCARTNGYL